MNPKSFFGLALTLAGALSGCVAPRPPSPPSAEQVRAWAGFPAGFQLQGVSEPTTEARTSGWGKVVWDCRYENRMQSLVSLEIVLCEGGTLWGTNRTRAPKLIEEQVAKMQALTNRNEENKGFQVATLPNGRKAYFTVLGFGPGGIGLAGFAYGSTFDLLVIEDFDAQDDTPPEKKLQHPVAPTNALPVLFEKVHRFLDSQ